MGIGVFKNGSERFIRRLVVYLHLFIYVLNVCFPCEMGWWWALSSLLTTRTELGGANGELDGVYLVASSSTRQRLVTSAQKGAHTPRRANTDDLETLTRVHSPTQNLV